MPASADEFIVQSGIDAAGSEKSIVCAALDDVALAENEDEIGFANGAKAMGNNKCGAALQQQFERALKARFGHRINRAGGFVEYDDARVWQEGAGKANELALAEG